MSTSSNELSTVLGGFGAKLRLVNTGIGVKNPVKHSKNMGHLKC